MPFGDGTGPRGEGPLTGRAMGRCAGYPAGGYATTRGHGAGYGFRRGGGGLGWRNRYPDTVYPRRFGYYNTPVQVPSETESLKNQVSVIADTIEQIAFRVNQLLKRKTEEKE
jgi:hypothetical protein